MLPFSYEMHEMAHFASAPARAFSDVARTWLENPINPLSYTAAGRKLAASAKIFERCSPPFQKLSSNAAAERETAASGHQLGNGNLPH
jgi:poly(3-hydroxybutyrate) depolymerase